jgi:hypothetical protein
LALKGYILDSQTVGKKMEKPHHTARAELTYNTIHTDTMKFDRKAVEAQLLKGFNVEHPCWEDKKDDYQFAPHQRSLRNVSLSETSLKNMNGSDSETKENPRKKAFSGDTGKEG